MIGSIEKFNVDPISDFEAMQERSFFNNVARVTNPATTGPANLVLPEREPDELEPNRHDQSAVG